MHLQLRRVKLLTTGPNQCARALNHRTQRVDPDLTVIDLLKDLTDLGDRYFVAIGSDKGFSALQEAGATEITEDDKDAYLDERKRIDDIEEP